VPDLFAVYWFHRACRATAFLRGATGWDAGEITAAAADIRLQHRRLYLCLMADARIHYRFVLIFAPARQRGKHAFL